MKQKRDLTLIGGGGHCRSCIDVIEMEGRFSIRGIVDEKETLDPTLTDYPLLGREEDLFDLAKSCRNFLITIGQIKSPEPRIRLFKYLKRLGVILQGVVIAVSNGAKRCHHQDLPFIPARKSGDEWQPVAKRTLKLLFKKMIPEYIPHLPAEPGGAEIPVPDSDTLRTRRRRSPK